jgi:hypothetical protein
MAPVIEMFAPFGAPLVVSIATVFVSEVGPFIEIAPPEVVWLPPREIKDPV